MKSQIIPALRMFLVLTALTGVIYPLAVTIAAKSLLGRQAEGSLVRVNGKVVGSELLAQRFIEPRYFWPRPSAGDDGTNYATVASSASNKGPTASDLRSNVVERAAAFRATHALAPDETIPAEMVFASGSGLDPHISPAAARLQIERVAIARKMPAGQKQKLMRLVEDFVEPPQLGFLGEPRVNVLKLNVALDSR